MSTFTERLVKQMLKLKEVEIDYDKEQSVLTAKEKRESELQKEIEEAEEQLKKVEALRSHFEKLNDEAEAQHQETKKKDQEERTAISQGLTAQIDEINKMSAELGKSEIAAEQERLKYERQLEIYSQHNSSDDKLKSIKETRDEEFKRLQEKQAADMSRVPETQRLLELETAQLEAQRTAHATVKAKVDDYVSRFAGIQSLLDQSKKLYEDAKTEKERNQRTIKKLEEDRTHAVSRAKTSQKERQKEFDRMRAVEEKLSVLNTQHAKLQNLLNYLEGNETAPPAESDAAAATASDSAQAEDVSQISEEPDAPMAASAPVGPVVENDVTDGDEDEDIPSKAV